MIISNRFHVVRYPCFFRTSFSGPPWVASEKIYRLEVFAGNLYPGFVVWLRLAMMQDRVPSDCGFLGFVAYSCDGLRGPRRSCGNRSDVQLVSGCLNPPNLNSWLAPAPWNYSQTVL